MTGNVQDIYPDFIKMAEAFGVPARRVIRPEDLRPALRCAVPCDPLNGKPSASWLWECPTVFYDFFPYLPPFPPGA